MATTHKYYLRKINSSSNDEHDALLREGGEQSELMRGFFEVQGNYYICE